MVHDLALPETYLPRVIDGELDVLMTGLPAIAIEGAKGIGKTVTALRRARTAFRLDDPGDLEILRADPGRIASSEAPVLIDEWQRFPESWDIVRRAVDADPRPGRFLLTGSATLRPGSTHSGAGRIVTLRMRPLALSERGMEAPTVSLTRLIAGDRPAIDGTTAIGLEHYVREILGSGLPGLPRSSDRTLRASLDGYLARIAEVDFPEMGHTLRNPVALRGWMRAYAAATSTTATFETIRAAAMAGRGQPPARTTVQTYLDTLERIWIVEPVPGWATAGSHLSRLAAPPKHQLADPALAARLVGATTSSLLEASSVVPRVPRDGTFMGALFEALVTLEVRVAAQAAEASVSHLRTRGGDHEVDLILERADGAVIAIEVKLTRTVDDADVRHLRWLRDRLGDRLLDAVVVTTGPQAYRRRDGIAVVPAALLGP